MLKRTLLALSFCAIYSFTAHGTFVPVTISSGFNQDVIANGVGNANVSTTAAVDLSNFNLVSADFKALAADPAPPTSLPANGIINSVATAGLTFQLGNYSASNALSLTAAASSGTLNFTTPLSGGDVYVLGMTGNGPTAADIKVKFTDATFQTFTNIDFPDWFGGAGFAIQNIGRINRTNNVLEYPAGDPRLYQRKLTLSAANMLKQINAIEVTKANATGVLTVYAVTLCTVPVITASPFDASICEGGNTSFAITATNVTTYKWQVNTGSGYTDISDNAVYNGSSTATLNINAVPSSYNNYTYRCKVKSGCDAEAMSSAGSLIIKAKIDINLASTNISTCTNGSVIINLPHAGVANSYQWQIYSTTTGFANIPLGFPYNGINSNALVIQEAPDGFNGAIYRCIVTGDCNNETSDPITLVIYPAPYFKKDPEDAITSVGNEANFTTDIEGDKYTVYWQASSDNGATYVNINDNVLYKDTKTKILKILSLRPQDDGLLLRCILKSTDPTCGTLRDTSNAAKLTVKYPAAINAINKEHFSIYPNPITGNELFIHAVNISGDMQATVIDNTGRILYNRQLERATDTRIELPSIAPGMYILKLNSAKHNKTFRFLKQ